MNLPARHGMTAGDAKTSAMVQVAMIAAKVRS